MENSQIHVDHLSVTSWLQLVSILYFNYTKKCYFCHYAVNRTVTAGLTRAMPD